MKEKHYKSYSMTLGKSLNIFKPQTVHSAWNYYEGKVKCLKHWAQYLVFCNLSLNLRYYKVVLIPLGTQSNYRPRINLRSVGISVSLVICRGCSFSFMIPSSGYELCSKGQYREEHFSPEVRPTFVAPATTLMRWRCLMTMTLGSLERRIALGKKKKLRRSVGKRWEVWGNSLWRWDLGSFQGEMGTFSCQDRSMASWVKRKFHSMILGGHIRKQSQCDSNHRAPLSEWSGILMELELARKSILPNILAETGIIIRTF